MNRLILSCLRCGHTWMTRSIDSSEQPKTCPNKLCRSPYWNKPRQHETHLQRARCMLRIAIAKGVVAPITAKTKCEDCGKRARVYDHRDYAKPLEVAAVCHACNRKRGPGLNRDARVEAASN